MHMNTHTHSHSHTRTPRPAPPGSCVLRVLTCLVLRAREQVIGWLLEPHMGQEPEPLHTEPLRSFHYSSTGAVASAALKAGSLLASSLLDL